MWHLLRNMLLIVVLMAGGIGTAAAQSYVRVNLDNRSYAPIWIMAFDPVCEVIVFEAVLVEHGSTTVKVCAGDRNRGSIIIYDRRGRSLSFSKILDGSGVDIRFR